MTLTGIELLTDEPIGEQDDPRPDGLGFKTYAHVLARTALGTKGPFTIGIIGEWGTGKTSLMKMIERELEPHPEVATAWFNAWQYEQDEHPIVPLLATMLQGVQAKKGFLDKLGERGQRLLNSLRAIAYSSSFKASIGLLDAAELEAVLSSSPNSRPKMTFPTPTRHHGTAADEQGQRSWPNMRIHQETSRFGPCPELGLHRRRVIQAFFGAR